MIIKMRRWSKILFIIVAATFIGGFLMSELWQMLRSTSGQGMLAKGIVGKVGKKKITLNEYRNAFNYFLNKYQIEKKIRDLSQQDFENIQQQTWQYLTTEKSWQDILKKTKIKITEPEIIEIIKSNPPPEIQNNPEFYTDGKFNYEKYQQYMFAPENRVQLTLYAQELADALPKEKFRLDVLNSYRVTSGEINDAMEKENTSIKVTFLYFSNKVLTEKYTPTEDELKKYYAKNKSKYERKESYRVKSVFFPLTITSRDSLDAQRQIEDAYELTKTEEFNILIRDFSENPTDTTARWIKIKELDSISQNALRKLTNDSVTPPILTSTGWQIIKVVAKAKDSVKIQKITKSIKITRETETALLDSINAFLDRARTENFDTLCQQYGLFLREMPPMTKDRLGFPGILSQNQFKEFVLKSKPGAVSKPLKGRGGYYIFQYIGKEPKSIQPFDKVKSSIEWTVRREKEKDLIKKYAEEIMEKVKNRVPLESIVRTESLIDLRTEEFNSFKECRNRRGSEFAGTAYALNPGEVYGVLSTDAGAFIIRCDERRNNATFNPDSYRENRVTEVGNQIFQDATRMPEILDFRDATFF
ncbi:MAG: peptidyl-prolyl cis-trans isomerase [candidate division WOR-3 bacterium]|nr:peptidyl-prolyl cis-trans isomerase [candidate division WOR-3 bacterium]